MERALMISKGREELLVGDIRAFIGAGDIFAINPDEIINTDVGFGGLQDQRCSVNTPYGYFWVDRSANGVYLLGKEGIEDVGGYGLRNYFEDSLDGLAADQLRCTYDPEWDRIILTSIGNWTVSYYPKIKVWGSFHSYQPIYYLYDLNTFYSIRQNAAVQEIWTHNQASNSCNFYGSIEPSKLTFVENRQPMATKLFSSLSWIAEVYDQTNGDWEPATTFDTFRVYNNIQDSGETTLTNFTNMRYTEGSWRTNDFRNLLVAGVVDTNKPDTDRDRIRGKWAAVDLTFNNTDNKSIYLFDTDFSVRLSQR